MGIAKGNRESQNLILYAFDDLFGGCEVRSCFFPKPPSKESHGEYCMEFVNLCPEMEGLLRINHGAAVSE